MPKKIDINDKRRWLNSERKKSNGTHTTALRVWYENADKNAQGVKKNAIVQELCDSRGGRPGLSVLTSLLVSVDVKIY